MTNYLGHCAHCEYALFVEDTAITTGEDWKGLLSTEARRVEPYGVYSRCPQGHKAFRLAPVQGKFSAKHECDSRCMNAKGTDCTCSCSGANHGRGYAVEIAILSDSKPISDEITDKQADLIRKLIDEREMTSEARTEALRRVDTLTKKQASAWIDRLLTLPKIDAWLLDRYEFL